MPSLEGVLIVNAILFGIGVLGVLTRRNAIILFMCAELMLNAVNLSFVAFAKLHNVTGHVFVVMVMTRPEGVAGPAQTLSRARLYRGRDGCGHEPARVP